MSIGGGAIPALAVDEITSGSTYYIQNVSSGKYLAGANSWGTQASVVDEADQFKLTLSDGKYSINDVSLSREEKYCNLGSGLYTDDNNGGANIIWTIAAVSSESGVFTIAYDDNGTTKYLAQSATAGANSGYIAELATEITDAAKWYILTKDEVIAKLANATADNPISAKFLIGDANFSRNHATTPWSMTASNQNLSGGDNNNNCCESYHSTFTLTQTLTGVPNGKYKLSAQGFYRQDGSDNDNLPYFYLNDTKVTFPVKTGSENSMSDASASFTSGSYKVETDEVTVTDGTITLGAKNESNASLWCIWDNFDLTYYGPIDLSESKTALAAAVTDAEAVKEGTIPTAAYNALKTTVDDNNKEYNTTDEYTTAINTIKSATTAAIALQSDYTAYNTLKSNIQTLENGTNYTDNSGAKSTLDAAITTQDKALEAATTSEGITTATAGLRTAGLTFVGAVTPSTSNPLDLTFLITNASFANNNADGWTYQSLPNFQSYGNAEYYMSNFDINQTLTGMPKGNYELKVKAFQRAGWAGSEGNVNAYIYINDYSALIKAAKDEAQTTRLASGNDNNELTSGGGYIPNNMYAAGVYFDKGLYENSVLTSVDGTLKFGFKCENGTGGGYWTIFDDFRLYYYGNAVAVTLTEDGDFSAANDMDNATVTLTRTFNANAWNTLVLPFNLTAAQVTELFGSSAQIATYAGTTAGADGSYTLNFTEGETTISANVPVLIYGATDVNAKEITGLTIKTGTPTSTPTGAAFAFTGSYNKSTTLTAGDFFISSDNKFYKANGKESMKGLRAVFRAVSASTEAKSLKLNIGGTATGINGVAAQSVDDGAVYNVAGQKVSNSYKGLVIKNGKKYLRK